jgi:hypothetical protein
MEKIVSKSNDTSKRGHGTKDQGSLAFPGEALVQWRVMPSLGLHQCGSLPELREQLRMAPAAAAFVKNRIRAKLALVVALGVWIGWRAVMHSLLVLLRTCGHEQWVLSRPHVAVSAQ